MKINYQKTARDFAKKIKLSKKDKEILKMSFPKVKPHKKKTIKKKLMSMKRLEQVTWTIFSRYIRLRDSAKCGSIGRDWIKCYTCGKDILFADAEASHFIPRGKHIFKFNPVNVNSCCVRCNHFLHGNLGAYALHLIKDYGEGIVNRLIADQDITYKFTREELECIRKDCANKIAELI